MRTVYALFVGIDDYPGKPLHGCVNDAREAESWLRRQSGPPPVVRTLYDDRAGRAAVLAGIEGHLGSAGPGDTALLWFSGHGSERPTDDPREATGWSQALVCHDSLDEGGQALLLDSELGALLDGIAARGTHVVAVLDCCHSGGATRDGDTVFPGATTRGVQWRPWWRTDRTRDGGGHGTERSHVLLAACRPRERAHESNLDGRVRGWFSNALLRTLDRLGPTATYGQVHALAEERVRAMSPVQHPELRGPEDGRFLSGDAVPTSPFLLRHTTSGWEVNCGHAHGLRAAGTEFTLLGEGAPRTVVVRAVRPESALVEPAGWQPGPAERESVHAVTPSALAFAPADVTLTGDPGGVRLLSEALAGVPALAGGGDGLPLRVEADGGRAWVSGGAGHPVPALPLRSAVDAARVTDCLAHMARWHHIRDLANPDPWLSSLVRISVEGTSVGAVRHSADGEIVCSYTPDGREPQVMVRIHNQSDRQLWCVLLDLTDGYGSSPHLYEGEFVGGGRAGLARRGEPVWLRLPAGRSLVRGAFARDWLKVIVTENELNLAPFRLPAWSPDAPPSARENASPAGGGALLRLTGPGAHRDAGGPAHDVGRWGTAQVVVRTEVP
ncbi:caspase family protein [Streptomyces sp. GESEQ-35]|uniref:caspase family protein n=1 Tax=Streptomyces sp. GESEQ-35 TaxID=2812657 RepID=UPI001B333EB8|nr:caspase family protein [Streptomyces sp. GESEQ-35]